MARKWYVSLLVTLVIPLVAISHPSAAEPEDGDEARGYYLGGGMYGFGVEYQCLEPLVGPVPAEWHVDVGAACDLPCPGGTCSIEVVDDVKGEQIVFRVCVEGEEFCRPGVYRHTAYVIAPVVTVAPYWLHATHGVVIVR